MLCLFNGLKQGLKEVTYKEWNETVFPVISDGLLEFVAPQTKLVVRLNVPDLN